MAALRTPACFSCRKDSVVEITDEEYFSYCVLHDKVQFAFPERNADFRELIITGTHNACWMTMFCDTEESQMDFQNFMWIWCALTGVTKMGRRG